MKRIAWIGFAATLAFSGALHADAVSDNGTVGAGDGSLSFDGFYVGAFGGTDMTRFQGVVDTSDYDEFPSGVELFGGSDEGQVAGLRLGSTYRRQMFAYGWEVAYSQESTEGYAEEVDYPFDRAFHSVDHSVELLLRAGTVFGERTFVYGLLGASAAESRFRAENDMDDDADVGELTFTSVRLVAGVGVEWMLTDNWSLRTDVVYQGPGRTYDFWSDQLTPDMDNGDWARIGESVELRLGASFHF